MLGCTFVGEIVYVGLKASAVDVNVMLSDHSIMVNGTFIGLRSQRCACVCCLEFVVAITNCDLLPIMH